MCRIGQLSVTLDRIDVVGDDAHDRGRVTRPRAYLQYAVAASDRGRLDHQGYDVGLGDGLPRLDRQRPILVRELREVLGDEALPRNLASIGQVWAMPPLRSRT